LGFIGINVGCGLNGSDEGCGEDPYIVGCRGLYEASDVVGGIGEVPLDEKESALNCPCNEFGNELGGVSGGTAERWPTKGVGGAEDDALANADAAVIGAWPSC
jgi:hypothetical protein